MEPSNSLSRSLNTNISLTKTEKKLFEVLNEFVELNDLKTTIRVVGGWVRDKVTGRDSNDIDLALDNMGGKKFIFEAQDWLRERVEFKGFGIVKAKNEQSKHMETVVANIMGQNIDITNLRGSDTNSEKKIKLGTPEEDAYARDLTINSLFYNIKTGEIEDFTKKGLNDLKEGIARTPLPPQQTLTDDPIRVLRIIKFITKFELKIDPELAEGLKDQSILDILGTKIGKARIAQHLKAILVHSKAFQSITNLYNFNIIPCLFEIPPECVQKNEIKGYFEQSYRLCEMFGRYFVVYEEVKMTKTVLESYDYGKIRFLMYMTGLLGPFGKYNVKKDQKEETLPRWIMAKSFNFSAEESNIVTMIIENKDIFRDFLKDFLAGKNILVDIGKFLRKLDQWGKIWELIFIFAAVNDLADGKESAEKIMEDYGKLYEYIYDQKLQGFYQTQALLNAKDIKKRYKNASQDELDVVMDNLMRWQIENPFSNAEELKEEITKDKEKFKKGKN